MAKFDLAGKTVLITGGSRGLGAALAAAYARAGCRLALVARNRESLERVAEPLRADGREVQCLAADLTSDEQVGAAVAECVQRLGRLDVLVNCAGISTRGLVTDATPEEFQRLMELNLLALVRMTRACLPHLLAARGMVVNIGSLSGKTGSRYLAAYSASKFAVTAYSQQLRLELGEQGLHTLLVLPGPIRRDDAGHRYDDNATGLPEAARLPGAGVKLRGLDPERLAAEIVTATANKRVELVRPRKARLLFVLSALCARWGDWMVSRATR